MKVKWHQQSLAKEPPTHPPPLLKAPTDVKQTRTQVLMHCMGLYTMSVLQTLLMAKWSKASPSHFFFIFLMQKTKHRSKQKISHSKNKVKQKWSLDLKSDLLIKSHRKAGLWLKSLHLLVPRCSRNSISHAVPLALGSTVYSKNYGIFQSPLTDQRFRSNRHFEQKLPQLSRANALTTHNGHIPQLSQTSQQTGSIDRLLPSREPVYEQANVNERREKTTKLTKVVFVF